MGKLNYYISAKLQIKYFCHHVQSVGHSINVRFKPQKVMIETQRRYKESFCVTQQFSLQSYINSEGHTKLDRFNSQCFVFFLTEFSLLCH